MAFIPCIDGHWLRISFSGTICAQKCLGWVSVNLAKTVVNEVGTTISTISHMPHSSWKSDFPIIYAVHLLYKQSPIVLVMMTIVLFRFKRGSNWRLPGPIGTVTEFEGEHGTEMDIIYSGSEGVANWKDRQLATVYYLCFGELFNLH